MSFLNIFVAAGKAISEWHRREKAYAELMALDDRSLADIGVRRSEIPALIHGVPGSARSAGKAARSPASNGTTRQVA